MDPHRRICFVAEGGGPCAWYRCETPAGALRTLGHEVVVRSILDRETAAAADIVVLQRASQPWVAEAIRYLKEAKKLVVFDIDDDLWNISRESPAYSAYSVPGLLPTLEAAVRASDMVTTTTDHLAHRLRPMNPKIRVLPNMLPVEYWPVTEPKPQRADRVVIGWSGTATHAPDMRLVLGVIEQILDLYGNVEFAWAGMQMPLGSHPRARQLDPVPLERYFELVGQFDIGLVPLVDSVFNRSKSDLKVLEYAMMGLPVVASRTPTYGKSVSHGETGFLASNHKDWLRYLKRLVEDVTLRRSMGAAAQEWAQTRTIDRNIWMWERAYGIRDSRRDG